MSSLIVNEAEVVQNVENPTVFDVPDAGVEQEEPREAELALARADVVTTPEVVVERAEAPQIEMVPAIFEQGLVYRPTFEWHRREKPFDAQFWSEWAWNLKPHTDMANAERLYERCGSDLHYCAAWKKWLVWDERRWEVDRTGKIQERAKEVLRDMREMMPMIQDPEELYAKHVRRSSNRYGLNAMIELAQTIRGIPVTPEQLDADPWLLNCVNGTLDLRTGKLKDHRREDLLTKLVPVEYNAKSQCPVFEAFLSRIMKDNGELIRYLQRVVGYCLTGDVSEKALFILFGEGNNGKTTFLEAIRHVLADYAGQVPIQSLMKKNWGDGIPNDIAQLQGKRFVTSSETESGQELAVAKIKNLVGLATLQARYLYAEFFEFLPTFKILMDCKHKPKIPADDPAIWNRVKFLPFTITIKDEEIDRQMGAKLMVEAPGILAWAVRGCLEWQRRGLDEPDEVKAATQSHRREMDTIGRFIEECCEIGKSFRESSGKLYGAYAVWCDQFGEQPESPKAFGMALGRIKGLEPGRNGIFGRHWTGIRLRVAPQSG